MKKYILFVLLLATTNWSIAQDLGRRVFLGLSMQPISSEMAQKINFSGNGLLVKKVNPSGTGAQLNVQVDDVLMAVNDVPVGPGYYQQLKKVVRAGDQVTAKIFRNGEVIKLEGIGVGTPKETYTQAEVIYDDVAFDGGHLRSIILKPKMPHQRNCPVIFYVQGFSCNSVEQLGPFSNSSVKQMLEGFVEKGYVVYRVEKLGMGDSSTEQHCVDVEVNTEIEGFRAALKKLRQYDFVNTDQIFLWGHSLGAMQAPFIAEDLGVAGIIGFGFVAKCWHDYLYDIVTVQLPLIEEVTYGEMQEQLNVWRMPIYDFMFNKLSVEQLQEKYPQEVIDDFLQVFSYNGKTILGRVPAFLQSLNDLNLVGQYQKIKVPTLSLYGRSDLAAIGGDEGVIHISDAINQVAPGNGYYQIIPETNHFLAKAGNMQENAAIHKSGQIWQHSTTHFNRDLIEITHDWITNILTKK